MSQEKTHDLYDFMRQLSDEMAEEYDRIQKRATEDPGTAGDQGEENWAELLRGWLPRTYEVVTKGRIISQDGRTSPQVDVLVLKDVYPEKLLNKKLYLAAGVAAAFECKTTLTAAHIAEAMETCVKIKNLYPIREGTPYKELHAPIVYGLLAHSHTWNRKKSRPIANITKNLSKYDRSHVSHPRECLDILCIANLAAWTSFKVSRILPKMFESPLHSSEENKVALTSYFQHSRFPDVQIERLPPIGAFISNLLQLLAWEDPALRDFADYYRSIDLTGAGEGKIRLWTEVVYSQEVRHRVERCDLHNKAWNESSWVFPYLQRDIAAEYTQNEESS